MQSPCDFALAFPDEFIASDRTGRPGSRRRRLRSPLLPFGEWFETETPFGTRPLNTMCPSQRSSGSPNVMRPNPSRAPRCTSALSRPSSCRACFSVRLRVRLTCRTLPRCHPAESPASGCYLAHRASAVILPAWGQARSRTRVAQSCNDRASRLVEDPKVQFRSLAPVAERT
jgi:hypothetical protein